jgi:hypothetical protein
MDDLTGGSFTITYGGVFGSLVSTPIINYPQVGILGLHKTQDRPVAINGKVEIRPMMYIALSYDHRIIDGQQAVLFLVRVKELMEDPATMLIDSSQRQPERSEGSRLLRFTAPVRGSSLRAQDDAATRSSSCIALYGACTLASLSK